MIGIKMIDDATVRNAVANDMNLVFDSVRDAFKTIIENQACHPKKTKIFRPSTNPLLDDWIFAMPAYLTGIEDIAGVKWASRCPGSSEGNVHILLILNETISNKPIAIMDGMYISLLRTFAITKYSVGTQPNANGDWWKGYVSEVLIYNSALSTTNRQIVETYLATKWSI